MAYIGNTNTTQAFTPAVDYFSGNGSTTAFTLSRPVASVAQVQVAIENVPQNPGSAFTVSGNTITFTSAPPSGTSNIYVYYTSPITQVIAPSDGTVGTTQIQDSAVTTAKIAAGAVAQVDLATGVAGTGPAFSATRSAAQTPSAATWTKVQFSTEEFDTANCYDPTTNYRFTPNVAGYYQITSIAETNTTSLMGIAIYKNGSAYRRVWASNPSVGAGAIITSLIYMNGSTDYVESYIYENASAALYNNTLDYEFSGALVRAA